MSFWQPAGKGEREREREIARERDSLSERKELNDCSPSATTVAAAKDAACVESADNMLVGFQ